MTEQERAHMTLTAEAYRNAADYLELAVEQMRSALAHQGSVAAWQDLAPGMRREWQPTLKGLETMAEGCRGLAGLSERASRGK